jgi:predicted metalloprotease with PDZ domain
MKNKLSLFTFILLANIAFNQTITYHLKMPKPQNHYFEVEMIIDGNSDKEVEVKLPVWAPGSYLVREFSKNINLVTATDLTSNTNLKVDKKSKNSWKINTNAAKKIKISYEVYSFELTVRTSFLDLNHAFVSGTGVFMYVEKLKEKQGFLNVYPHPTFKKVTTSLPKMNENIASDNVHRFNFSNYDQLVDCPIEIGNHEVFDFSAAGVKHTVAMFGEGNYNIELLKKDMAKIVEASSNIFSENPNKEYVFIIHNVTDGQGGLEHSNSTTLSVNRWSYKGSEYLGFLSLVAHEYFHLWNVKRIRPIELGPFNYDSEVYTTLLWVMEGFTSYYDELILKRAGYYSDDQLLSKISGGVNYVEGSVGSRVQPVAHASFDAWIKAYRPNENSANTTMTYYSRGAMLAAILDAKIITKFAGKKCLDHFLQKLYLDFYKKQNRGFTEKEFKNALSDFMNEDMNNFFADFVDGTKTPDFKSIFKPLGVDVQYVGSSKPNFGATFSGGKIKAIRTNSSAENMGLSVNDEIIGYNSYRVTTSELDNYLTQLNDGDEINLLISRDNKLLELKGKMESYERASYKFSLSTSNELQKYWLREINL